MSVGANQAVDQLGALAQETRLGVFRALVPYGETGLSVGQLAELLDVNMTTLSRHLSRMVRAGLLIQERQKTQIFYKVNFEAARGLMAFLMEDCCKSDSRLMPPAIRV